LGGGLADTRMKLFLKSSNKVRDTLVISIVVVDEAEHLTLITLGK